MVWYADGWCGNSDNEHEDETCGKANGLIEQENDGGNAVIATGGTPSTKELP